jgi:hypothetical protein
MERFLAKWNESEDGKQRKTVNRKIESATDDEMLAFIDQELGRSESS